MLSLFISKSNLFSSFLIALFIALSFVFKKGSTSSFYSCWSLNGVHLSLIQSNILTQLTSYTLFWDPPSFTTQFIRIGDCLIVKYLLMIITWWLGFVFRKTQYIPITRTIKFHYILFVIINSYKVASFIIKNYTTNQ